jgi:SAM-dependent methyltransferase
MQAYGRVFAKVYNLLWNDFADRVAPQVHEYYATTPAGQEGHPVLDLCCGTGRLSRFFLERDFRVVGLDLSEHMISWARQNNLEFMVAGQAAFIQGDASDFKLDQQFGLTVAIYDSLNHLPDEQALKGCFRCVFEALEQGGVFIFDLNTQAGLQQWNGVMVRPGGDIYLINRGMYDQHTVKAWTKITGFVRDDDSGLYERFEESVYNTVFEMEAVRKWLLEAGFGSVRLATDGALETPIEDPEAQRRVFFVAIK